METSNKPKATYLEPTESSARKNVNVENISNDVDINQSVYQLHEGRKDLLFSSNSLLYTPSKHSKSGFLKPGGFNSPDASSNNLADTTTSPNREILISRSQYKESSGRRSRDLRNMKNCDSCEKHTHESTQIVERVVYQTTKYSPVSNSKTTVIHDKNSPLRKDCCSAKKIFQSKPEKVVTIKSIFYQVKSNPITIGIQFNNQMYNQIKNSSKEEMKNGLKSNETSLSKLSEKKKHNFRQSNFDIEGSDTNTFLSKLICARIEEEKFLKDKKGAEKNKLTVLDLKQKREDLKKELQSKKNSIDNLKVKSDTLKSSFNSYKIERGPLDQKSKIEKLSENDLKEYIRRLKELKSGINDSKIVKPNSLEYIGPFEKRHDKLVSDIDNGGLKLNYKLSDLHPKLTTIDTKITKSVDNINKKIDKREDIKEEWRIIDKNITSIADIVDDKINRQLQELNTKIKLNLI